MLIELFTKAIISLVPSTGTG